MLKRWSYPILQVIVIHLIAIGVPFTVYINSPAITFKYIGIVYNVVVITTFLTSLLIWVESILALNQEQPLKIKKRYPKATAIIAAYLPNEKETIIQTLKSFFKIEYPTSVQIILAYNSPHRLEIESDLYKLSKIHPNLELLKVYHSKSKAENVNAALRYAEGEFVGVFDADHNPEPKSFKKAWKWLSNGYDVVQGRCSISNSNDSWLTRLIAIEFETMYGLNHVGRNRLHGFGIFGGSNGYWKTDLLKKTGMRSHMMTEDIDSSLRVVANGHKIASDPSLVSMELAPVNINALWNQRMRWAQGWFQVSVKHHKTGLISENLTVRQKLGMFHLLVWREIFPWIAIQIVPIILFWLFYDGGRYLNLFIPIYIFTTLFSLSSSIGQIIIAKKLALPNYQDKGAWFIYYFAISFLFYSRIKDTIAMISHIQEFAGQRSWKVTPRSSNSETHSLAVS